MCVYVHLIEWTPWGLDSSLSVSTRFSFFVILPIDQDRRGCFVCVYVCMGFIETDGGTTCDNYKAQATRKTIMLKKPRQETFGLQRPSDICLFPICQSWVVWSLSSHTASSKVRALLWLLHCGHEAATQSRPAWTFTCITYLKHESLSSLVICNCCHFAANLQQVTLSVLQHVFFIKEEKKFLNSILKKQNAVNCWIYFYKGLKNAPPPTPQ